MVYSEKEFKALHIRIWDWLADNPTCTKDDWPEWIYNGGTINVVLFDCFACQSCDCVCVSCPCTWDTGLDKYESVSPCIDGEYGQYIEAQLADDTMRASAFARIIRNCWK